MQAEEVDYLICIVNSPARGVSGARVRTAETYEVLSKTYAHLLPDFADRARVALDAFLSASAEDTDETFRHVVGTEG